MKSAETSQPEFLCLLKQRDRDAWHKFYTSSITRLYNFIYYKLHRNQQAAEEVTQETYLNAYADVERYSREKGEVESWLTGIASNQVRSFLRRSRRRKMETLGGAEDNLLIPNQPPSPEELLANQEVIDGVNAAIAELPERYGTVLKMKYMAMMSVREIAGKIESTEKAAERMLSRARDALKRSLAPSQATLTGVVFVSAQKLLENNLQLLLTKGYKPVAPREVFRQTLEKNLLSSIKRGAEVASAKSTAATASKSIVKPLVVGGTVAALVLMSVLLVQRAGDVAASKSSLPSPEVARMQAQDSPAGEVPEQPEKTAGKQAAAAPGSEIKDDKQKPQGLPDVNEWEILEGLAERLYKIRVTLSLSEPSLKDALGFLRDITGVKFVVSEEIPEVDKLLLAMKLTDVPVVEVLEAICLCLANVDYGLCHLDNKVPTVVFSTPEDILRRKLEKPDSFIETIDCCAIKAKLPGRSCPFGLIEEELQKAQAFEKKLKEKVKFDKPIKGHSTWVHSVAVSPDGKTLASVSRDEKPLALWSAQTGKRVWQSGEFSEASLSVEFSPDGKSLATGSCDGKVRIRGLQERGADCTLGSKLGVVTCVSFSTDGKLLLSASTGNEVRIWDMQKGECLRILSPQSGIVLSAAFCPDVSLLAAAGGKRYEIKGLEHEGELLNLESGHNGIVIWGIPEE